MESTRTAAEPILSRYGQAATADEMYRIATARLVLADHDRLLADFPQLRPTALLAASPQLRALDESARAALCRQVADQWLVQNAALISAAQTGSAEVNTRIATTGPPRTVARPPRYGRACVAPVPPASIRVAGLRHPVPVRGGGELDIKGVGVAKGQVPGRGDYADGLISLADTVQEYLIERLLDAIFTHAGAEARTLPHYGIIDTGFDGLAGDERFPAALIVRRAHLRDLDSDLPRWDSADQYLSVRIELLLRRYGVTSSNWEAFEIRLDDGRLGVFSRKARTEDSPALISCLVEYLALELPFVADRINIQMDVAGDPDGRRQVVDFGHYSARRSFHRPLVSLVSDRPMAWGGMLVPADDGFAQPDPLLVPSGPLWADACRPGNRLFRGFAAEVAAAFRNCEFDHVTVGARATAALDELTSAWPPGASSPASASAQR